jgi:hypothetical protein
MSTHFSLTLPWHRHTRDICHSLTFEESLLWPFKKHCQFVSVHSLSLIYLRYIHKRHWPFPRIQKGPPLVFNPRDRKNSHVSALCCFAILPHLTRARYRILVLAKRHTASFSPLVAFSNTTARPWTVWKHTVQYHQCTGPNTQRCSMVNVQQVMRYVEIVGIWERCELKEKFTLGNFLIQR